MLYEELNRRKKELGLNGAAFSAFRCSGRYD